VEVFEQLFFSTLQSRMLPNQMSAEMHQHVAGEVNNRMAGALEDLQAKYASGQGGTDSSANGPTGAAYKQAQAEKNKLKKEKAAAKREEETDDNDYRDRDELEDGGDDEDYELRLLREKRLKEIRNTEIQRLENLAKGHGQYREIVQDEFLTEVTGSFHVICHFYHREFPRCKIMDKHLEKISQRHVETKFVYINAEKTPFFVEKLKIRTMPTLVFFEDGVATGKQIGFEGLSDVMPEGREDEWRTVQLARILGMNRMIDVSRIVDDDEEQNRVQETFEERRKAAFVGFNDEDFDLDNLSDDDT
jgi:thiol-disulfide isomerase/thioredoxin